MRYALSGLAIFSAMRLYFRMKLREKANLPSQCCRDFLAVFFCGCCSIVQEA